MRMDFGFYEDMPPKSESIDSGDFASFVGVVLLIGGVVLITYWSGIPQWIAAASNPILSEGIAELLGWSIGIAACVTVLVASVTGICALYDTLSERISRGPEGTK